MTIYELIGKEVAIKVNSFGAELISLVDLKTNQEYMWEGDSKYWGRVSPILFPLVGKIKNQQYKYKGKVYNPKPHGFARDMEFNLEKHTEDELLLSIESDEETLKVYPFVFKFYIEYKIEGRVVKVSFKVENKGNETMYFSLGAHPGFKCPLNKNEKRSNCYIKLHNKDNVRSRIVNLDNGLVTNQYIDWNLEKGLLPIDDNLFDKDALVIENQINQVSLADSNKETYITLKMDAPVYGIWSAVIPGSPFVCIEPWFGRCDAEDFEGEFQDREYQNRLESQKQFNTFYTITI